MRGGHVAEKVHITCGNVYPCAARHSNLRLQQRLSNHDAPSARNQCLAFGDQGHSRRRRHGTLRSDSSSTMRRMPET